MLGASHPLPHQISQQVFEEAARAQCDRELRAQRVSGTAQIHCQEHGDGIQCAPQNGVLATVLGCVFHFRTVLIDLPFFRPCICWACAHLKNLATSWHPIIFACISSCSSSAQQCLALSRCSLNTPLLHSDNITQTNIVHSSLGPSEKGALVALFSKDRWCPCFAPLCILQG